MAIRDFFPTAAAEVVSVIRAAGTHALDAPTPCTAFDLKALVNHFIGTSAALTRVGLRVPLDAEDPYGSRLDPSAGDWPRELAAHVETLARAWSEAQSWEGTVDMGGGQMPATMIGEMALAETLLHGWDLARTTGQQLTVADDVAAELRRSVEETAALGRSMGAYGREVSVPEDASDLDRALGASGRDPYWSTGSAGQR